MLLFVDFWVMSGTIPTYDTTTPEDIILGLGLGCNGVIEILIEPLATDQYKQQIQFIDECLTTRKVGKSESRSDRNNF